MRRRSGIVGKFRGGLSMERWRKKVKPDAE